MATKRIRFFAQKEELVDCLKPFKGQPFPLVFVEVCRYQSPENVIVYGAPLDIDGFGTSSFGDTSREKSFLVMTSDTKLTTTPLEGSGILVTPSDNTHSIVLVTGGLYLDQTIIAGELWTNSTSASSIQIFDQLTRRMKKNFAAINGLLVSPKSLELGKSGYRLTHNAASDRTDLKIN